MNYTDKPVWTFPPNWDNGVLERLEWVTDVLASETGAEQRISKRLTPRRSFELSLLIGNEDRQYFDNAMAVNASAEWLVPLWHDVSRTTAPMAIGANFVPVDTTLREFVVGGYAILRGRNARSYEVVQIASIAPDGLQLIANNVKAWPQGTIIYPARFGMISDMANGFTITKQTDTFHTSQLAITLTAANPNDAAFDDLPTYNGLPVIVDRPDESNDLTLQYTRLLQSLDGVTGLRKFFDTANLTMSQQQYAWAVIGRAKNMWLRKLLYALKGRLSPVWLPTFMQDFTLLRDISTGEQVMTVANTGYTSMGMSGRPGRQDVRIELRDGTFLYRKIITSAEIDDTAEAIGFSEPFPFDIPMTSVRSISFMGIFRLDTDSIEINHDTDVDGLSRCTVTWKSTPAIRNAEDWEPYPWPDAVKNAIQAYCACICSSFDTMSYMDERIPLLPDPAASPETWMAWLNAVPAELRYRDAAAIQQEWDTTDATSKLATISFGAAGLAIPAYLTPQDWQNNYLAYKTNFTDYGHGPSDAGVIMDSYKTLWFRMSCMASVRKPQSDPSAPAQGVYPPKRQAIGVPDADSGYLSEACMQIREYDAEQFSRAAEHHVSQYRGATSPFYCMMVTDVINMKSTNGEALFQTLPPITLAGADAKIGTIYYALTRNIAALTSDTIRPRKGAYCIMLVEGHESTQRDGAYYYGPDYTGDAPTPNPDADFREVWSHLYTGLWLDDKPWPQFVIVEIVSSVGNTVISSIKMETAYRANEDGRYTMWAAQVDPDMQETTMYTGNPKYNHFDLMTALGQTVIVRVRPA